MIRPANRITPVNSLLVFVPISLVLCVTGHGRSVFSFVAAALAIVPLAGMIGHATEEASNQVGVMWSALLNSTCGNATELIIGLFGLAAGQVDLVRASIAGSIIGNLLLVLGGSIFAGGLYHKVQRFNQDRAESNAINLVVCTLSLSLPAIFAAAHRDGTVISNGNMIDLSDCVAVILLFVYAASLWFAHKRHDDIQTQNTEREGTASWPLSKCVLMLSCAAILVAIESEILVRSVNAAAVQLGVNKVFIGVIIVSVVGNAAEHSTAVGFAIKNKMELSMNIAIGSSMQIAMLVAPILVLSSLLVGHPLTFLFSVPQLAAIGFSVLIVAFIAGDGKCHWLEGAQMLAAYAIIAFAFLLLP